ncbi:MAG: DUF115 domain-containing protein [Marinisporobacter sp.]|jgi:CMP-N-acetylneuraminic acid synthetase|nr:DUF115 domain-containing protein [Marinisporobacter sp.]
MSLYAENIQFLKEKARGAYNAIVENHPVHPVNIEKTEERNNFILSNEYARCFLNSVYDQEREMKEMFKDVAEDADTIIVFGFGNGSAYEYIKNNLKHIKHIYFIEPTPQIFNKVLESYPFKSAVLEGKINVTIRINIQDSQIEDHVLDIIRTRIKVNIVYHLSYCSLFQRQYEIIKKSMLSWLRNIKINMATSAAGQYTWLINTFENLNREFIPVEKLKEKIKNKTAIIVSAGPSLEKNIELLKKVKDHGLIIAVGSAIKILENRGIVPHFRCAIDGFPEEEKIFDGIDSSSTALLYGTSLYKNILPEYYGDKFEFVLDADFLARYIHKKAKRDILLVQSGFSIASITLNLLTQLEVKTIVFMGQDLCYTNNELYAKGSWKEEKVDVNDQKYIKTKDVFGNDVYTIRQFLGMKQAIEGIIRENPNIEYINATQGGLSIEGTINKNFCEVLDELDELVNIKKSIEDIKREYSLKDMKEYQEKLSHVMRDMEKNSKNIVQLCEYKLKKIKRIERYKKGEKKLKKLYAELNELDDFSKELANNELFNQVVAIALSDRINAIEKSGCLNGNEMLTKFNEKQKSIYRKTLEYKTYSEIIAILSKRFLRQKKIKENFVEKALFIVPAHEGVKEEQYIKKIGNIPLMGHTIREAKKISGIDKVVVATDSDKIANVAQTLGAQVPFILSKNNLSMIDQIKGTLEHLKKEGLNYEDVVLLHPEWPLRTYDEMIESIALYLENDCDTVVSTIKMNEAHCLYKKVNEEGFLIDDQETELMDMKELYQVNEAICITKVKNILENKSLYGKKIKPYMLEEKQSMRVNTELKFKLVDMLLNKEKDDQ